MSKRLAECQRVIGYAFANPMLLEIALTHSSVRTPDRECNERQEFLGDSVLGLAITEELYKRLPDQQEGELTRIKSAVVSRGALYRVSTKLGLTRFIEVAKGVARREELPVSLTANLVESIIGAVYLDGGFFPAREFILRHLGPEIEDVFNDRVPKNFKSLLQHEAQQLLGVTPVYRTVEEEGPDHRKAFTVAAILKGTEYGRASGINKREAEQEAARHALEALKYRGRRRRRRLPELRDPRESRERDPRESRDRDARDRDPRERDRDRVRSIVRQSSDADDWRAWAEAAAARTAEAPPSSPTPYAIGPEADEGFLDEGAPHADAGRPAIAPEADVDPSDRDDADRPPHARAPERDADRSTDRGPASTDAPSAAASEADGDGPRGRRRRGRRGGRRGRGGDADPAVPAPSADDGRSSDTPIVPEADGDAPAPAGDEGGVPRAFLERPPSPQVAEPSSWPDGPSEPEPTRRPRATRGGRGGRGRGAKKDDAPAGDAAADPAAPTSADAAPASEAPPAARAPRTPRGERAPRDAATPREAPAARETPAPRRASSAKPPAAATGPAFGAGVAAEDVPPPLPSTPAPDVTPVAGVEGRRKAPVAPKKPPADGGFGVGL